jgi:hypothetical protein
LGIKQGLPDDGSGSLPAGETLRESVAGKQENGRQ